MGGPLAGIEVIELAGIGPGPFCAMLLGDLGADVVRVDRTRKPDNRTPDLVNHLQGRNKRSISVDLKHHDGRDVVLSLVERADVLIEGFRPGVAERLGLGPESCHERNPRLVYGRMTGWGRYGPLADKAGHDINYIGLTGALHAIGREGERPVPPLNLVGDYGGGALYLAMGILAALFERSLTGVGDVVDAAMVDGAASLMTPIYEMLSHGLWKDARGENLLDGAAPFYDTYETSDGKFMAVGPIEPQFFANMLDGLGLDEPLPEQSDADRWPELRDRIAARFLTRTRDEWAALFSDRDACVTPVLSMSEAPDHRHNRFRGVFVEVDGVTQPAPAPRFGRWDNTTPESAHGPGADTLEVLREMGVGDDRVEQLLATGAVQAAADPKPEKERLS